MADPVNTSCEEIALIVGKADWYANVDARAGLAHYLADRWPTIRAALSRPAQRQPEPLSKEIRSRFEEARAKAECNEAIAPDSYGAGFDRGYSDALGELLEHIEDQKDAANAR